MTYDTCVPSPAATEQQGPDSEQRRLDDGGGRRDERIVAGLRQRDPAALAELYKQYAADIYNLALRMLHHVSDAEDITQDVLIRAYERLPSERHVPLRPWLLRVTLNRCYDHLRSNARRRPVWPADGSGDAIARKRSGEADPLAGASRPDPFEQSELRRLIEASLDDITPRQRAALLLKDVHGLTLVEVADCLELTPGSVEVLLARARGSFRTSFEARCRDEGRPVPGAAKMFGALPALFVRQLPESLVSPPTAPLLSPPPPPLSASPAGAAGVGFGGGLCLTTVLKTGVLIIAAAATVSTTALAVTLEARNQTPAAAAITPVQPVTDDGVSPGPVASAAASPKRGAPATGDVSVAPLRSRRDASKYRRVHPLLRSIALALFGWPSHARQPGRPAADPVRRGHSAVRTGPRAYAEGSSGLAPTRHVDYVKGVRGSESAILPAGDRELPDERLPAAAGRAGRDGRLDSMKRDGGQGAAPVRVRSRQDREIEPATSAGACEGRAGTPVPSSAPSCPAPASATPTPAPTVERRLGPVVRPATQQSGQQRLRGAATS